MAILKLIPSKWPFALCCVGKIACRRGVGNRGSLISVPLALREGTWSQQSPQATRRNTLKKCHNADRNQEQSWTWAPSYVVHARWWSIQSLSHCMCAAAPTLSYMTICHMLSGTGDSQRDSRESIRANHSHLKTYFYSASGRFARITRTLDSRESPDSRESCESIRVNHATKVTCMFTYFMG